MTDFHTHILPCVDDGSQSMEQSLQMLSMQIQQGVGHVVLTPHFYPQYQELDEFLQQRDAAFEALQAAVKDLPQCPTLYLGTEVHYYAGMSNSEELRRLTVGNTPYILVEMPVRPWNDRDYRELDYAVHSDPVSGLANRNSCDAIIEQYQDKPLPRDVGCVMLVLRNIRSINEQHGHAKGNEVIREFSTILKLSSVSLCFVGRNGGNKFLAIFEQTTREDIDKFLERVERKVTDHNGRHPDRRIEYGFGIAFEEPDELKINGLVALSDRRCGGH